jgi:predicted dithiol-disulfide oxidoreductase (DUF899 family)
MNLPSEASQAECAAARQGKSGDARPRRALGTSPVTDRAHRERLRLHGPGRFLDLTPPGRQEDWERTPAGRPQTQPSTWWRLHDAYDKEHA